MNQPAILWGRPRSQNRSIPYFLTKRALSAENYGGARDYKKKDIYLTMHHDPAVGHAESSMSKLFQGLIMLRYVND